MTRQVQYANHRRITLRNLTTTKDSLKSIIILVYTFLKII